MGLRVPPLDKAIILALLVISILGGNVYFIFQLLENYSFRDSPWIVGFGCFMIGFAWSILMIILWAFIAIEVEDILIVRKKLLLERQKRGKENDHEIDFFETREYIGYQYQIGRGKFRWYVKSTHKDLPFKHFGYDEEEAVLKAEKEIAAKIEAEFGI